MEAAESPVPTPSEPATTKGKSPEQKIDREAVRRALRQGATVTEIAAAQGVHRKTVQRAMKHLGLSTGVVPAEGTVSVISGSALELRREGAKAVLGKAMDTLIAECPDASEIAKIEDRLFGLAARGGGEALASAFLALEGIHVRSRRLRDASVAAAEKGEEDPDWPCDKDTGEPFDPRILVLGKSADHWTKVLRGGLEALRIAIGLAAAPRDGGAAEGGGTTVNVYNDAVHAPASPEAWKNLIRLLPDDEREALSRAMREASAVTVPKIEAKRSDGVATAKREREEVGGSAAKK